MIFFNTFNPHLIGYYATTPGNFDQLVYTDPDSGKTVFAVESLMDYELEFYFDDFLEDDDTWANSAYDSRKNYLYFQCTQLSGSDDQADATTALCRVSGFHCCFIFMYFILFTFF